MFNFTKCFLAVLFVALVTGCSDKGDDVAPQNVISFDGKSYDLAQGVLIDYGQRYLDTGHNLDLILLSSGLKVYESGGKLDSIAGKGHAIYFEIFSSEAGTLGEGAYVFDPRSSWRALTFDVGSAVFDSDLKKVGGINAELTAGTINVAKAGTEISMSFDCAEVTGKRFTGNFKGIMKYFDGK